MFNAACREKDSSYTVAFHLGNFIILKKLFFYSCIIYIISSSVLQANLRLM